MHKPNRNDDAEFLTPEMAMQKLNLCRTGVMRLAVEADALFQFGRTKRINWNKLKSHFEETYKAKAAE